MGISMLFCAIRPMATEPSLVAYVRSPMTWIDVGGLPGC